MGWVVLALRKAQLKAKINDNNLAQLQLNRELQNLTSFSTAIADGYITPSEIASIGTSLFGDAMDFMYNSTYSADAVAQEQTSYYTDLYSGLSEEQYYNNPDVASQVQLYYKDGALDENAIYNEFLEENLKEYASEYFMPILNEKQKEIENQLTELQTLGEAMSKELQAVDDDISNQIQSNTIKLN